MGTAAADRKRRTSLKRTEVKASIPSPASADATAIIRPGWRAPGRRLDFASRGLGVRAPYPPPSLNIILLDPLVALGHP